ncbi:MAG: DUF4846 domain-containing protein [Flavitalea sp.]
MQFKPILTFVLPISIIMWQTSYRPDILAPEKSDALIPQSNTFRGVVEDIQSPPGFERVPENKKSFASWLRSIALSTDNTVYLFNGAPKHNQQAQYAVLDIPVGKKDLQQCADAVMRLRAQYLRDNGLTDLISFSDNAGKKYQCPEGAGDLQFERYLETVFSYCGTLSLEKQLRKVPRFDEISCGDVLIKGGSPGHAVIVVDVVTNRSGKKMYMLAQSYMPAQSIHILKNPIRADNSPWYDASGVLTVINTPEWTFDRNQLRRW